MKTYSIILPVHQLEDTESKSYIDRAIESLVSFNNLIKLLIIYPKNKKDIEKYIFKYSKLVEINFIENEGETDFCSQVNLGISKVDTEWFSILEFDDTYSSTWFTNTEKYISAYNNIDVFFPIVADVDDKNEFLSFTNESVWAVGFSSVQGELDNEILLEYQNYQISGAIYKTEKIKAIGVLKPNIKLSFGYEFLLRLTNNNIKIMTIPKIGYKHTNMRPNSLFWNYKNDDQTKLSAEEAKFWMGIAKKEFFFSDPREINYIE